MISCYHREIESSISRISQLIEALDDNDIQREMQWRQFTAYQDKEEGPLSAQLKGLLKRQISRLISRMDEYNWRRLPDLLDWSLEAKSFIQILRPYYVTGYQRGYRFAENVLASRAVGESIHGITTGWLHEAEETPDEFLGQRGALEFIDEYLKDLSDGVNDTTKQRIMEVLEVVRGEIEQAIADGKGISQLAKAVEEKFKEAGTDIAEYRALMIARTELIRALNGGARRVYEQSGFLDDPNAKFEGIVRDRYGEDAGILVVEHPPIHPNCRCAIALDVAERKLEWITSADERVCDICGPMDGTYAK